jgi:hypothetical protein
MYSRPMWKRRGFLATLFFLLSTFFWVRILSLSVKEITFLFFERGKSFLARQKKRNGRRGKGLV